MPKQLDRLAGDGAHRERGAATAVAVDAGEHDACEPQALVEGAREIDSVLAGERIGDEEHLMRIGGALDLGGFVHHRFVERSAAGGVEQDGIEAAEPTGLQRALRNLGRMLAGDDRQGLDIDLLAKYRELLHCGRAAHVERRHQHLAAALLGQPLGDLGGGRRLAGALQPDHHDRHRRERIEVDRLAARAKRLDQLVVHQLDHELARRHRLDQLDPDRVGFDLLGEGAHHLERHVGLEQRAVHLAQRRIDVGLGERATARQPVENAAKPFRQ